MFIASEDKAGAEVIVRLEPSDRLRARGGGDKPLSDKQPWLIEAPDLITSAGGVDARTVIELAVPQRSMTEPITAR